MRTFERFPKHVNCPICGTNKDEVCFLMPIDGTSKDNICEAAPTHVSCMDISKMRINKEHNFVYFGGTLAQWQP